MKGHSLIIVSYFCFTEGVLAQETDGNVTKFGSQLIAATYAKFIESAGGRMVPILYPLYLALLESCIGSTS